MGSDPMPGDKKTPQDDFERVILPHLNAAYNLAHWLLRNPHDAEDAVQDAFLKAYNAFGQFQGEHSAAWILTIVRNTCLTLLKRNANHKKVILLETGTMSQTGRSPGGAPKMMGLPPDANLIAEGTRILVQHALEQLPQDYREVIVLREFEDMTYQQIADITGVPLGTVMSRLSRARQKLRDLLTLNRMGEARDEL